MDFMTSTTSDILVLGGTGKTGRRLIHLLDGRGRSAARSGADVRFDWSDDSTWAPALDGARGLYLVPPALRLDFAQEGRALLDRAEQAGVEHVVVLSARGVEHAPPEVAMRALELDIASRQGITSTILRPAFFAQNFTEGAFSEAVHSGVLALPAGDGTEAFIDVADIAAVAAASLVDPARHAGAEYELTGPRALTHQDVAETIAARVGRPVRYTPVSAEAWIDGASAAGLPPDYAGFLAMLLQGIAAGQGSRPTGTVEQVTGRPATDFAEVVARELPAGAAA